MERETQPCDLSVCPSFNTYSSAAEVAGRARIDDSQLELYLHGGGGEDDEDDFEFVSLSADPDGEFFVGDGEIRPIFPVFDGDLLLDRDRDAAAEEEDEKSIRIPLKKLFVDDRDPPSSSCSEADETERIAPGVYCFWTPKLEDPSPPRRCEKSNSTGSSTATATRRSRWWRFRDLLKRSNSEGAKGSSLVFLTPAPQPPPSEKRSDPDSKKGHAEVGPAKSKAKTTSSSAHEKLYVRNRKMREEDKRRSYLPYRQDLVGFFANVNGAGRNFPPF